MRLFYLNCLHVFTKECSDSLLDKINVDWDVIDYCYTNSFTSLENDFEGLNDFS